MNIRITQDGVPIYQQIINQVKYMVASGRMVPGDELPAIRVLAEQLVVNPNTVARAYRELETLGIVTSRHGSGTYISETGSPLKPTELLKNIQDRADSLLSDGLQMGLTLKEMQEILQKRYDLMQTPEGNTGESKK